MLKKKSLTEGGLMEKKSAALLRDIFSTGIMVDENGPFKFKLHESHPGAPKSPVYFNLRFPPKGRLTEKLAKRISEALYQCLIKSHYKCDCIVGVPRGGNPFAKELAVLSGLPVLSLEKKEEETRRSVLPVIHGRYKEGWEAVLVDEVLVMADSKIEAIEALGSKGITVSTVIVFLDWEHGGKKMLEKKGIQVISVFSVREVVSFYLREGMIGEGKYSRIMGYIDSMNAYFGGK